MNVSDIPKDGVLFTVTPTNAPDEYWVHYESASVGICIGRIMLRHDGLWSIYADKQEHIGDAKSKESARDACIVHYLSTFLAKHELFRSFSQTS